MKQLKKYELKDLSVEDLKKKLKDLKQELLLSLGQQKIGSKDTSHIRNIKRNIARIKTYINQKINQK